jgi:hypothetical protein
MPQDLTPYPLSQNVEPMYVASGLYSSGSELLTPLAHAETGYYWHIQSMVFMFQCSPVDLTNGATLNTVDQFGVPTAMAILAEDLTIDPIPNYTVQTWQNEVEFDTEAGFGIWLFTTGSSHCSLTVFGWKVLWTPAVV